jgi:LuxR family maltose regulon positive regulatory protein
VGTDLAVRAALSTNRDEALLESKFAIPEPPPFMVPRPRLVRQLSPDRPVPLIVVTGPAGSGKTQLVAAWATGARVADHIAWITIEDEDDAAGLLWVYIVEALRRAGVSLPALGPLPPAIPSRSFLTRLASRLREQTGSIVLILDGISSLTDLRWAKDLEFVARHAGDRFRLVVVGRFDPPMRLHRYRLAGNLVEVRSADLAFGRREAAALLALHGIALSPPALTSLLEHTEGWAAGLRLFALALEGHQDADRLVDTISGDEASIAEYFAGEVLQAQAPQVRDFLLHTSVLGTFTPELAMAVTESPDAHRVLAELDHENAFVIRTGDQPATYRYHRLFAELLQAHLVFEEPDQVPKLHYRAAGWFADHGQTAEAVVHAVKAGDWETASALAVADHAVARLLLDGRTGRLGGMFRDMPDDVDTPPAAVVAAALAMAEGDTRRSAEHLARVADAIASGYDSALTLAGLLVEASLAKADRDAAPTLRAALGAESLLPEIPADHLALHPELRAVILTAKGTAQHWLGEVDAAATAFADAAGGSATGYAPSKIDSMSQLAIIEAYRGRLGRAQRLATEAIDLAEACGTPPPAAATVALAWVAVERYDMYAAGRHLSAVEPADDGLAAAGYALVKARRLQARGELGGAMRVLSDVAAESSAGAYPSWLAREILLGRARLLAVTGHPDDALALARELPDPTADDAAVVTAAGLLARGEHEQAARVVEPVTEAAGVRSPVAVDAELMRATIAGQTGNIAAARDSLRRALRLAAPEGQRRAVHQVWARLRRVLREDDDLIEQYRALSGEPVASRAATKTPRRGETAEAPQAPVVDPLSPREREVLIGMAEMLPTEEIAASMYVSVNTVKTHIRSILRKLSASRRNEAVRRARTLGLI